MNPAAKRFSKTYGPIADVISRAEIAQVDREAIAAAMTEALEGRPDFRPAHFRLIASDPLCPCAGYDDRATGEHVPCPEGIEIRIAMHLSSAPDGRSEAWRETKPTMRCVSCGAKQFIPGHQSVA